MTTTTTTMVAKTTCFPDDIWSQIKGFLFESNLKCALCKCSKTDGKYKLIKTAVYPEYYEGCELYCLLASKKSAKYFGKNSYQDIRRDIIESKAPIFSNIEDYYTFHKGETINMWYCESCWSNRMFRPYKIRGRIMEHYGLNYSQTEKICLKLTNMFCADDKSDCGMTIFDRHRLKTTREKHETYIRFMEEYYRANYKADKTEFEEKANIDEQYFRKAFKHITENLHLENVNDLHNELCLYQVSNKFKTGKMPYKIFKKLMDIRPSLPPKAYSYSQRYLKAFGRDIYD